RNQVGVRAAPGQSIEHNLIYRNALQGVLVDGGDRVWVANNTLYAPAGDALRIQGSAREVEVRNNILWSGGGYALYVANDSQSGFFSDFNTLHASGGGRVAYWTRDFTDL